MRGRLCGPLVLFTLLGCSGGNATSGDAGAPDAPETLKLFTWWVAPGEVEALRALVDVYETDYPMARVDQFNMASSANWQTMLAKGIDVPTWDVVQISAAGLAPFTEVHSTSLAPVDAFYEERSLKAAVIPDILAATKVNGHSMGVVTGVHRNNAFIFNRQVLTDHGLAPPTTIAELLVVCAALKGVGITPIATPLDPWILRFLYLDLLSGVVGTTDFGAFITHKLDVGEDKMQAGITTATDIFVRILTEYVDIAAAKGDRYDWTTAADAVGNGTAGMIFLGDWVKGYLVHLGWDPDVDFGVSGPPGASDLFVYGADTFALPAKVPHPESARDFLAVVASPEAQVAFNKWKGSTPMRIDVRDMLDAPGRRGLDDLVNAKVRLPGIDNAEWDAAMAAFVATGDKAALLQSLLTIVP